MPVPADGAGAVESAMADPNDSSVPPDGRQRRPPRTIDVEAVAVPAGETGASATPDAGKVTPLVRTSVTAGRIIASSLGAVAALVVAAALWIAMAPRFDGGAELTARLAVIEAGQRDDAAAVLAQAEKLDELSMRFARLSSPALPAPVAANPALADRLAALEAEVKPLAARIDETDRRTRDAASAAKRAGERADEVAGEINEIKTAGTDPTALPQSDRTTLAGLAARLDAAEAALKSIQQSSAASAADMPLRGAMVATALRMAVERGDPFAAELAAARTIGLDPAALAVLEPFAAAGVPRRNELFREFSALLPELIRVSAGGPAAQQDRSGNDAGNYLDRLLAGAEKLVRIRPVGQGGQGGDLRGDDPAAVIGRIELAMTRQDVAGIVAELDKLPAPARESAEPWRKKALAREAAIAAARRLAAASLAGLVEQPAPAPDVRTR